MSDPDAQSIPIRVDDLHVVSGMLQRPANARACFVLAPGAGAGMGHPFLVAVAMGLETLGIATLRYEFPYMERRSRRPDAPALCHATVRAAVSTAATYAPTLPLFAGGKSFGGRMTSQAHALGPLPRVVGLIFLGFPLHPASRPADDRAAHLADVAIPMLFLQGTRDELAHLDKLRPVIERRGHLATLHLLADADHAFHVPARTGRTDAEVLQELPRITADWIDSVLRR